MQLTPCTHMWRMRMAQLHAFCPDVHLCTLDSVSGAPSVSWYVPMHDIWAKCCDALEVNA